MKRKFLVIVGMCLIMSSLSACEFSFTDNDGNTHSVNVDQEDVDKIKEGLEKGKDFIEQIDKNKAEQNIQSIKKFYENGQD